MGVVTFYTLRPLGPWAEAVSKNRRGAHVFKASWSDTLTLLRRELDNLDAKQVVLQVDLQEADLRIDGMPRASAKIGQFPGVRIRFDSKHGPLTYATDAYERHYGWSKLEGWQANVRAIALGLEALRAVDRYGVTRRGEQYTGWKQLPSGIAMPAAMTVEQAASFIATHAGSDGWIEEVEADPSFALALYKDAAKILHPDAGGSTADFQRLQDAKRVLEAHFGSMS